jgi:hypothetical protein
VSECVSLKCESNENEAFGEVVLEAVLWQGPLMSLMSFWLGRIAHPHVISPLFCDGGIGSTDHNHDFLQPKGADPEDRPMRAVYCAYHMLPLGLVLLLHDENKFGSVRHKQWKEVIGFIKFILSLNYAIAPEMSSTANPKTHHGT